MMCHYLLCGTRCSWFVFSTAALGVALGLSAFRELCGRVDTPAAHSIRARGDGGASGCGSQGRVLGGVFCHMAIAAGVHHIDVGVARRGAGVRWMTVGGHYSRGGRAFGPGSPSVSSGGAAAGSHTTDAAAAPRSCAASSAMAVGARPSTSASPQAAEATGVITTSAPRSRRGVGS